MAGGFSYNQNYDNQRDLWLRYYSEPEKELNGRRIDSPRGIGWGGSSAINAMQLVKGQSQVLIAGPNKSFARISGLTRRVSRTSRGSRVTRRDLIKAMQSMQKPMMNICNLFTIIAAQMGQ